jgi:hypothetical protein
MNVKPNRFTISGFSTSASSNGMMAKRSLRASPHPVCRAFHATSDRIERPVAGQLPRGDGGDTGPSREDSIGVLFQAFEKAENNLALFLFDAMRDQRGT